MLFERLNTDANIFALAFVPPNNSTEKHYVLPKEGNKEDTVQLTLHKNPVGNKYVFRAQKTIID